MRGRAAILLCALVASPAPASAEEPRLATLADLGRHLATRCRDPRLEAMGASLVVRFALSAEGVAIAPPVVTAVRLPPGVREDRALLAREADAVIRTCTPVPLSAALGRAIAGRPLTIRIGVPPAGRARPQTRAI